MAFPVRHKLLTVHGRLWRLAASGEEWSFGIRFEPGGVNTVSQAQVDACDAAVRTWWADLTNGPLVEPNHQFLYCKLAPIATDGKYPPGEISFQSAGAPVNGFGSSGVETWPGQCAPVVTLLSIKPGGRGRGSHGRLYLPPLATTIGTDGRMTAATATRLATGVRNLIVALNAVTNLGTAAVFSAVGAGERWNVGWTRAGTVVDTQRRRRRQLAEVPTAPVAI